MVQKKKNTDNVKIEQMIAVSDRILPILPNIGRSAVESNIYFHLPGRPSVAWMRAAKYSFRIFVSRLDENGQKQYDPDKSGNEKTHSVKVTENDNVNDLEIFEEIERMFCLQKLGYDQK